MRPPYSFISELDVNRARHVLKQAALRLFKHQKVSSCASFRFFVVLPHVSSDIFVAFFFPSVLVVLMAWAVSEWVLYLELCIDRTH